jgi:uncharacterized membrane protein
MEPSGGNQTGVYQTVRSNCTNLIIWSIIFGFILLAIGILLRQRSPVFLGLIGLGIIAIITSISELWWNINN